MGTYKEQFIRPISRMSWILFLKEPISFHSGKWKPMGTNLNIGIYIIEV